MKKVILLLYLVVVFFGCKSRDGNQNLSKEDSLAVIKILNADESTGKYSRESHSNSYYYEDKGKCGVVADQFAKKYLNYPEESDFSLDYVYTPNSVTETATVLNKFTAKNAFGVKKTYIYKMTIKYISGDPDNIDSWVCQKIKIEEENGPLVVDKSFTSTSKSRDIKNSQIAQTDAYNITKERFSVNGKSMTIFSKASDCIRLKGSRRLTEKECEKIGKQINIPESIIIYFHLNNNTNVGGEYAAYSYNTVFIDN